MNFNNMTEEHKLFRYSFSSSLNRSLLNQSNPFDSSSTFYNEGSSIVSPARKPRRSIKSMKFLLHMPMDQSGASLSSLSNFQSPYNVKHSYEELQKDHVKIKPIKNWVDIIYQYLVPEVSIIYYLFVFAIVIIFVSYWIKRSLSPFFTSGVDDTTLYYIDIPTGITQKALEDNESWKFLKWIQWTFLKTIGKLINVWGNFWFHVSVTNSAPVDN